jgi:hypothetical protein
MLAIDSVLELAKVDTIIGEDEPKGRGIAIRLLVELCRTPQQLPESPQTRADSSETFPGSAKADPLG